MRLGSANSEASAETLRRLAAMRSANCSGPESFTPEEKREIIYLIGDNALASFVVIHAALKRSTRLWRYARREDINRRMPGYQLQMGFGLHIGWAIEGAIGECYPCFRPSGAKQSRVSFPAQRLN